MEEGIGVEAVGATSLGREVASILVLPMHCEEEVLERLGELLGSGSYGQVFSLQGPRKLAVKRGKFKAFFEVPKDKEFAKIFNPDWDGEGKTFVPKGFGSCLLQEPVSSHGCLFPKGSYLCDHTALSEFLIGRIVGESFERGECANFFQYHSFFVCERPKRKKDSRSYTWNIVMDKVDGKFATGGSCVGLQKYAKGCPEAFRTAVWIGAFVQALFAVAFFQENFGVVHNDLHMGNLFAEYVSEDTSFRGERLADADWYRYDVGSKEIFLPAIPVVVKVGDFGLSVKFSSPMIGNVGAAESLLEPEYNENQDFRFLAFGFEKEASNENLEEVREFVEGFLEFPSPLEALLAMDFPKPSSGKVVTLGVLKPGASGGPGS